MTYLIFEDEHSADLLPLTYTRPAWDLRCGILTVRAKWAHALGMAYEPLAAHTGTPWLKGRYQHMPLAGEVVAINGRYFPNSEWLSRILPTLEAGTGLVSPTGELLAFRSTVSTLLPFVSYWSAAVLDEVLKLKPYHPTADLPCLRYTWDVFRHNKAQIEADFEVVTAGRPSAPITDPHTRVYNPSRIFLEPGVKLRAALLNAESGPIYLGEGAEVQELAVVSGAHAIMGHSVVNVGAKLRGDTTVGPYCKVGGEVSNSLFYGYSNKGHDGFVGNSVLGAWCNLGADTNTSNLKNNYSQVRVYSHREGKDVNTGLTFCGLVMGDHSKAGINTMFNTGTVVGVAANVFGGGFPPKFIPSFSWGGAEGLDTFQLEKAYEVAERMMARRSIRFDLEEKTILDAVFTATASQRKDS